MRINTSWRSGAGSTGNSDGWTDASNRSTGSGATLIPIVRSAVIVIAIGIGIVGSEPAGHASTTTTRQVIEHRGSRAHRRTEPLTTTTARNVTDIHTSS